MSKMNKSQIRMGQDPVLTTVVQQHRPNKFNLGDALFPPVPVPSDSGLIRVFGDEAFQIVDTKRAPGAIYKNVNASYSSTRYQLINQGLKTSLEFENELEGKKVGVDVVAPNLINLDMKMKMSLEKDKADLAGNLANYPTANKITLSGTSQFSDYVNSDPRAVVQALVDAIEDATGEEVTVMGMSKPVFRVLKLHPDIIAAAKAIGVGEKTITKADLAEFFGIPRIIVSSARFQDANTGTWSYFWGNDIYLAAVPDKGESKEYMSFAYTYQHEDYPGVMKKYWDESNDTMNWKQKDNNAPVIVSNASGALIKSAI
jgi:hypothetical protein